MVNRSRSELTAHGRRIVEALGGVWTRRSDTAGAMCRCPAHNDQTPSLSVRIGNSALLFKCFGAGCSGRDIIAALRKLKLWHDDKLVTPPETETTLRKPVTSLSNYSAAAKSLWRQSQPLDGTLADIWLNRRCIDARPSELRFHPRCPLGVGKDAWFYPAMLAAVRNELGLLAIQRTFLAATGLDKAAFERPRRTLGNLQDGAVRLFPAGPVLGLAEGVETALAAAHLLNIPVWATLGTERLGAIAIPSCVKKIVLLPDSGATAQSQTRKALDAYEQLAISATTYPLSRALVRLSGSSKPGAREALMLSDWNDLVCRLRQEGAGADVTAGMFADDLSAHLRAVDLNPKLETQS